MGKRPSMLIAACDMFLAGVYSRKFEREGWDVEVMENVRDAELRAVQMRPSVLLFEADCVVDAAAEVKRLRGLPTLHKTPIVILADRAHAKDVHGALKAGANDYLLIGHFVPAEAVSKMKKLIGV